VVSSSGLGLVAGGALSLRWRPRRALLVGMLGTLALAFPIGGLALSAPVALLVVLAFAGGIGIELFGVFWDLSMQQHVPRELLSRVYAYDMLGSIALMPLGYLIVGPLSEAFGVHATLWICAGSIVALTLATLVVRDVRVLERLDAVPEETIGGEPTAEPAA
jgi:MFS family permease